MDDELVRNWMTKNLRMVSGDTTLSKLHQLITEKHVEYLLVVDMGAPAGVISDRDIYATTCVDFYLYDGEFGDVLANLTARRLMRPNPATISPVTTLTKAMRLTTERQVTTLLVVEDGKAIGVITKEDILRGMAWLRSKEKSWKSVKPERVMEPT